MTFRPRIRTLKPEMWADEKIGQLSRDARLLFAGLITMADDEGRLRALPAAIIGHVFPYDDDVTAAKTAKWMRELEQSGLIVTYENGGRPYAALAGWTKHQRVNRANPSELPPPPGTSVTVNGHDQFTEPSVKAHGGVSDDASPRAQARVIADRDRDLRTPPTPQGGNAGEDDPTEPDRSGVVTFRRRRVPAPQLETAERALAAFNRHTGQNVSAYRSDGRPSEALTRILGAVTDKPEKLTGEYCERLVGDVLRRRWWGEGPASVGVVFGPAVLDRNLAALDGAGAVAAKSSLELAREIHGGAA